MIKFKEFLEEPKKINLQICKTSEAEKENEAFALSLLDIKKQAYLRVKERLNNLEKNKNGNLPR